MEGSRSETRHGATCQVVRRGWGGLGVPSSSGWPWAAMVDQTDIRRPTSCRSPRGLPVWCAGLAVVSKLGEAGAVGVHDVDVAGIVGAGEESAAKCEAGGVRRPCWAE